MARDKQKNDYMSMTMITICIVLILLTCYWHMADTLYQAGLLRSRFAQYLGRAMLMYKSTFEDTVLYKEFIMVIIICTSIIQTGKKVKQTWKHILSYAVAGTVIFMINPANPLLYSLTTTVGFITSLYGISLIFRKMKKEEGADTDDGFEQNTDLKSSKDSINIPYKFEWKGKIHNGWINCINPYRATMVLGSPGSGKTFAVYNPFIEQQIRKGFTMFVYDYKFPDLTERVLTEIAYQTKHEGLWKDKKIKPKMYILNFDDPLKSNRCNPIHHSYITDPADTSEIANVVFNNINKGGDIKGFDFFRDSAEVFLDSLIWFLANYDEDALYEDPTDPKKVTGSKTNYINKGKYCTFAHVIELMNYNYRKVFQILQYTYGLEAKITAFSSALENQTMEQLMGQIASAQIPMGKFVSPALYWVMSGDDFTLDINNPDEPKIVCMGNNPDRQNIYGTTLALYTSRMFKLINHKHKEKSAVLLDELPTVFIKGLDQLIATARSNKVAITLGAQDKTQLRRDYGDKESDVIMTTVGNLFSGSVEGRTAKDISENFGKEYKKKVSTSIGEDNESQSISYQLEDILPASRIVDMSQGTFCGWMKDNFTDKIKRKKFFGDIVIDMERNTRLEEEWQNVPIITDLFNNNLPSMTDKDRKRLQKIYPQLADKEDKLHKIFISELVKDEINRNFNTIQSEVKNIVEKEYKRTEIIKKLQNPS